MRKVLLAITFLSLTSITTGINAFAGNIDAVVQKVRKEAYQEGYKKGYEDAIAQNKEKWEKAGEEKIIRRLKKYNDLINRIFNYQVLLDKGMILPPQVALICDNSKISSSVYKPMNCYYEIVAGARFVKPQDISFKNLVEKGQIDNLVKDTPSFSQIVDTVYFIGVFDYDNGLRIVRKLYDLGFRVIQRNVDGKLVIAVFPGNDDKLAILRRQFSLRKMSLPEFMSYTIAKVFKKAEPFGEKQAKKFIKHISKRSKGNKGHSLCYLRVRMAPSLSSKVVAHLAPDEKVEIIGAPVKTDTTWYHIRVKKAWGTLEGYASAKHIFKE